MAAKQPTLRAMRFLIRIALALAACAAAIAAGSPGWSVSRLAREVPVESAVEVTGGAFAAEFTAIPADRIVREGKGGMWLRIAIERTREANEPLVLILRDARNSRVTLFPSGRKPTAQSIWSEEPSTRFARDALYFPLGNAIRAGDVHYLHIDKPSGGANLAMAIQIDDMATVNAANLGHLRIMALLIGALLALGCTVLIMWLWRGERAFLYYGGTTLMGALYLAFFFSEGYAWFGFSANSLMAFNAMAVPGLVGIGFDLLFYREVLDFTRHSRRMAALFKALAIFFFAMGALFLGAGGDLQRVLVSIANLAVLLTTFVVMYPVVVASARGDRVARLLFGAWAFTLLFTVWRVVSILRGEPHTPELYYGFPISIVAAAILKACALAERMRLRRSGRAFVLAGESAGPPADEYDAIVGRLRSACEQAGPAGQATAVLKVQVDNAALIAASHGKPVLRRCVTLLQSRIRNTLRDDDALGSVGDSELLVVLPGASAKAAGLVAERIRMCASASRIDSDGMSLAITVSVGLAWTQGSAEAAALMDQADAAAATADNAGGNRVVELPA
jgi:diguanylate cyclase (GGDEF)-like protein